MNGTFPTAGPYIEDDTEALGIPADQIPIYRQLLFYVRAHQPPSRWDVLTQGATTAAPLMLLGGRVAALGGYGTIDPVLTPPDLAALAAAAHTCRPVAPSSWRSPQNIGTAGHPLYVYPRGGWNLILYDCAGRTAQLALQH